MGANTSYQRGDGTIGNAQQAGPEEKARLALGCLEDKKATDIRVLHVVEKTILADYFIIASVDNIRQSRAIADFVQRQLRNAGERPLGIEGSDEGLWVLMDYGTVVIHIMMDDARAFYDLDNYWGDAPEVSLEPIAPQAA